MTIALWIIAANVSIWTLGFVIIIFKECQDGKIKKTEKWTGSGVKMRKTAKGNL